jgi:hypothetical protein
MTPMQQQMLFYADALRNPQRQQPMPAQQQQNPLDAAYANLRQIGMSHEQAIDTINSHMQQQAQAQQPTANQMQQGDQLTNNAQQQEQGHGTASGQYLDGAAHD